MITGSALASTGVVASTVAATHGDQIANAATQAGQRLANNSVRTMTVSDTVTQLVNNAESLGITNTVMDHFGERTYQESTLLIKEIMQAASPKADAFLSNGLKWVVEGSFNGSSGIYELVIDVAKRMIVHFLYKSK